VQGEGILLKVTYHIRNLYTKNLILVISRHGAGRGHARVEATTQNFEIFNANKIGHFKHTDISEGFNGIDVRQSIYIHYLNESLKLKTSQHPRLFDGSNGHENNLLSKKLIQAVSPTGRGSKGRKKWRHLHQQ
jgi:hypothetical protein